MFHDKTRHSDRKWPLPNRSWQLRMNWHDLLFMHYPIDASEIRHLIPEALEIDAFNGSAWLGIVPFHMTGVAPRLCPNIPFLSSFPELNVRTYVSIDGKPGVWFFSLEATKFLAVRAARRLFHLKYMDAKINFESSHNSTGKWLKFHSHRVHYNEPSAEFEIEYRPLGPIFQAQPDSFEEFLTSRYCLYTANAQGAVFRGEIDHAPWELREAQVIVKKNTMTSGLGLKLPDAPSIVHYARSTRAHAWSLQPAKK